MFTMAMMGVTPSSLAPSSTRGGRPLFLFWHGLAWPACFWTVWRDPDHHPLPRGLLVSPRQPCMFLRRGRATGRRPTNEQVATGPVRRLPVIGFLDPGPPLCFATEQRFPEAGREERPRMYGASAATMSSLVSMSTGLPLLGVGHWTSGGKGLRRRPFRAAYTKESEHNERVLRSPLTMGFELG